MARCRFGHYGCRTGTCGPFRDVRVHKGDLWGEGRGSMGRSGDCFGGRRSDSQLGCSHEPFRCDQATYANTKLSPSNRHVVCSIRVSIRRTRRILRLLPYDTHHVCPFHRGPIQRVRESEDVVESRWRVFAFDPCCCGWDCGWCGCGCHDASGCSQDPAANPRLVHRRPDTKYKTHG